MQCYVGFDVGAGQAAQRNLTDPATIIAITQCGERERGCRHFQSHNSKWLLGCAREISKAKLSTTGQEKAPLSPTTPSVSCCENEIVLAAS